MVIGFEPSNRGLSHRLLPHLAIVAIVGLMVFPLGAPVVAATTRTPSPIESKATALFKAGDYSEVAALYRSLPQDATPSKEFLRLALQSYVRLGRPDEALSVYSKLTQPGQSHDATLLRSLALGMITSHVRDRNEHVRIAAYSALAELGLPETAALLEDGLLDTSVVVRARAAEAIGKAGLAAQSGPYAARCGCNADCPHCRHDRPR